jgi:hypothetical protein
VPPKMNEMITLTKQEPYHGLLMEYRRPVGQPPELRKCYVPFRALFTGPFEGLTGVCPRLCRWSFNFF